MKLLSLILIMLAAVNVYALEDGQKIEINKVMDATDFPERVTQKLMGVDNGEILFFTSQPGESLTLDCTVGTGNLNYSAYSKGADSVREDFAFDSTEKCEAFSALITEDKDKIGVSSRLEVELDFGAQKIKSILISENL